MYDLNGNLLGKLAAAGDGSLPISFKNLGKSVNAERALVA
jgi:hypothetical protein